MLFRQDFRWRHQRRLAVILHGRQHRDQRYDCFATAHVALQQTIHGRIGAHICEDLLNDLALCLGEFEWQD